VRFSLTKEGEYVILWPSSLGLSPAPGLKQVSLKPWSLGLDPGVDSETLPGAGHKNP